MLDRVHDGLISVYFETDKMVIDMRRWPAVPRIGEFVSLPDSEGENTLFEVQSVTWRTHLELEWPLACTVTVSPVLN